MSETSGRDRLIVALDVPSADEALALVERLGDAVSFYKIGLQLFATGEWRPLLDRLSGAGRSVFMDLKVPDDIGNTVRSTVEVCARYPTVRFLTVSAQASPATIAAAREGKGSNGRPELLTVPLLSSMGPEEVRANFGVDDLEQFVAMRARAAIDAGCDGLIASGDAIAQLRGLYPGRTIVSPGIRPASAGVDDHRRSTTPGDAIRAGADYLVVGRPITRADDPRAVAESVAREIEDAR